MLITTIALSSVVPHHKLFECKHHFQTAARALVVTLLHLSPTNIYVVKCVSITGSCKHPLQTAARTVSGRKLGLNHEDTMTYMLVAGCSVAISSYDIVTRSPSAPRCSFTAYSNASCVHLVSEMCLWGTGCTATLCLGIKTVVAIRSALHI